MLVAILCRFCRCLAGRPPEREPSAKPEHLREALGKLSRGAKIEAWISQAQELAARK